MQLEGDVSFRWPPTSKSRQAARGLSTRRGVCREGGVMKRVGGSAIVTVAAIALLLVSCGPEEAEDCLTTPETAQVTLALPDDDDPGECSGIDNCCLAHADCGPGGTWDDGDSTTIDFCQANQCKHVLDPNYCDDSGDHPCEDDGETCTDEACVDYVCTHPYVQGCCHVDEECNDYVICTSDACADGTCMNTWFPVEDCCTHDSQCDDGNECNLDVCINHKCRYGPNFDLPYCCQTDADCADDYDCTVEYCDMGINICIYLLVPNMTPKCCFIDEQCDDDNPFTIDKCLNHQCYPGEPMSCGWSDCNDDNPCTIDACDFGTDQCTHYAIDGCCTADSICSTAYYTDDNPCTTDTCNLATHQCEFTPITECCASNDDCGLGGYWDDNNACTDDLCIGSQCKHVTIIPGCGCTNSAACADGISCTIDICEAGMCIHEVDYANPLLECCLSDAECFDENMPQYSHSCVNYECQHIPIGCGCANDGQQGVACFDGNPCTCDLCVFCICRNLTYDLAPASCNLSENCCLEDSDCPSPSSPCEEWSCIANECTPSAIPYCQQAIPFKESFNSCPALEDIGWSIVEFETPAPDNWKCTSVGFLGPDNHMRFHHMPFVNGGLHSILVTPRLDASAFPGPITLQFDSTLSGAQPGTEVFASLLMDAGEDGPDSGDGLLPLWAPAGGEDLPSATRHEPLPPGIDKDRIFVAFGVKAPSTFDLDHFDIDNVRVCPGSPPQLGVPESIVVTAGEPAGLPVTVSGMPPGEEPLVTLLTAPDFASTSPLEYSAFFQQWVGAIVFEPTNGDTGWHEIEVRATDGCLIATDTTKVLVLAADGYLIWAPPGVPAHHAQVLHDAIEANGRNAQIQSDLGPLFPLTQFDGIFVTLGVYGARHVLTNQEAAPLIDYLDAGGRVYLEGGDAWYSAPWTGLQPRFMVKGVADGEPMLQGSIEGMNMCYGADFDVKQNWQDAAFIDNLDTVPNAPTIPLHHVLTDNDYKLLAAAYEDPQTQYRTIGSSIPFAAFAPGPFPEELTWLMASYIDFFENGRPPCSIDQQCNDSIQCSADICEDSQCVNEWIPNCIVCDDDRDCPDGQGCYMNSHICMIIPSLWQYQSQEGPLVIDGGAPNSVSSTIQIPGSDYFEDVHVQLAILHEWPGDLEITLERLGYEAVLLEADPTRHTPDFYHTVDEFYSCSGCLEAWGYDYAQGNWTLTVKDTQNLHGGALLWWRLYFDEGFSCTNDWQCDDGEFCTIDQCILELGQCHHSLPYCDDGNECTVDSCDIDQQTCFNEPVSCDDANPCTQDTCDPFTGQCLCQKVENCEGTCAAHRDCGLHDYCSPDNGQCTPIPGARAGPKNQVFLPIPDSGNGALSLTGLTQGQFYMGKVVVKFQATHPYSGDLMVTLDHGNKNAFLQQHFMEDSSDDIDKVWGITDVPHVNLALQQFEGEIPGGDWTLTIQDSSPADVGTVDFWQVYVTPY